jgi:drug/metabolite transporter (DMT)-like permease
VTPRSRSIDALLVLMVLIWGANYSAIKRAFDEMPPQVFNALRIFLASCIFLTAIKLAQRRARQGRGRTSAVFYTPFPLTRRDRLDLLWLGVVGHWMYQLFFVGGVALTNVSNGALIIGATPIVIATVSWLLGRETIGALHWLGAAVSVAGIYFVVGRGASFGGTTLGGDILVMISVGCWTAYTIGGARLITRHSPLYVTGTTMSIGAVPYVILAVPQILRMNWSGVGAATWATLVLSAVLALCLSYLIWYTAVQRIGPARTSIFSNLVPIVAIGVAAVWLGEPLTSATLVGAVGVLSGVFLSRLGRSRAAVKPEGEPSGG